jgi:dUTP pyrophosphatase
MNIAIETLYADLPIPSYATQDSAGVDIMAAVDAPIVLKKTQRVLVPTGIKIAIPTGYEGQIRPRSGLALKQGLTVLNAPGTIDADYRGEIKVLLINLGDDDVIIERGMRIAQLIIAPCIQVVFDVVSTLETTKRGVNGFGSTGIQRIVC